MLEFEQRKSLASNIRRLVAGGMTNDDFDDVYYETYFESRDRAVKEISGACYGLYSSDLLFPLRLKGRNALDRKTKQMIARCVLFLRTKNEYEWPTCPISSGLQLLYSLGFYLGLPLGIALYITSLATFVDSIEPTAIILCVSGVTICVLGALSPLSSQVYSRKAWDDFMEHGNYECWPFLSTSSFEEARKPVHGKTRSEAMS